MKVKNIQTNEVVNCANAQVVNGKIVARLCVPQPGKGFFAHFPMLLPTSENLTRYQRDGNAVDCMIMQLADGWEITDTPETKERKKVTTEEVTETTEPTTTEEPTTTATEEPSNDTAEAQLINAIKALKGSANNGASRDDIRQIVTEMLTEFGKTEPTKMATAVKAAKRENGKEYYCNDFDDMVADLQNGFNIYMYGPAGCGKSHTAEQMADALGLPFYGSMQMEFSHELKGYGDAAGRFVETSFYHAIKDGGLFFLDEFDRSNSQITTVLNGVLEQGWFDFPVVGRVVKHPNFRVVAAGNTTMDGANEQYTAGQEIDASSKDRFIFYAVDYNKDVEKELICKGAPELFEFVQDLRQSLASADISLICSYRFEKYAVANLDKDKVKVLRRGLLKGLNKDSVNTIYGGLNNTANVWAKALRECGK